MSGKRCKQAVWISFTGGDLEFEVQCTKDQGHSARYFNREAGAFLPEPTEHRFEFETEPTKVEQQQ